MSCDQIETQAVAERYLLGELGEPEREAYERHYFDCERCFHELHTVIALRTQLETVNSPTIGAAPASGRSWWPAWLGAAAVVVLGVGLWTMMVPARKSEVTMPPVTAAEPAGAAKPPDVSPVQPGSPRGEVLPRALTELARFAPPPYEPSVLRGPEDDARRLFVAAMEHYARGEHRLALDGLRAAAGKDPTAPDASFFLGVCLLLTGQAGPGIAELKRTIALGNSPYLEEAHFYLAKGMLQVGDVGSARRELRAMIALGGDHQREAKQLLSQIGRIRSEH